MKLDGTWDLRADFPLLQKRRENGQRLTYLDSAATSQKPRQVLDAVRAYSENHNANPHRGAYALSGEATEAYEGVRAQAAAFIGAESAEEIVFTPGSTAALNTVALSYGLDNVSAGEEILISVAEHHSNLLPWQALARKTGATLRYLSVDDRGRISLDELEKKLSPRTKIVAVTHVSNVLGGVNPIADIAAMAHRAGAVLLVDAAQSAPHMALNVQALDADFLIFSGHKMLSPTGVGVLYGKKGLLEGMQPVFLGGGIVEAVTEQTVRLLEAPWKFEAGTPNVEAVVGLGAAMDYLTELGFDKLEERERQLTDYALERMKGIPGLEIYGDGDGDGSGRTGIISFNVRGAHPHDTASILDAYGICIRAGHHCAQPLMAHMGVNAVCRMSLYLYNDEQDVDRFADALPKVREVLGHGVA